MAKINVIVSLMMNGIHNIGVKICDSVRDVSPMTVPIARPKSDSNVESLYKKLDPGAELESTYLVSQRPRL